MIRLCKNSEGLKMIVWNTKDDYAVHLFHLLW